MDGSEKRWMIRVSNYKFEMVNKSLSCFCGYVERKLMHKM